MVTETSMVTETTVVSETTMVSETISIDTTTQPADADAAPVNIYDESGDPVARVSVRGTQSSWTEYEEGNEPGEGLEYTQVVVEVESLVTDGTFDVNVDHFVLQDNNGFITTGESVPSAAQAEAGEELLTEAELANAEAAEIILTFEVPAGVGPQSVFYRPDDDRLVDIAEIN